MLSRLGKVLAVPAVAALALGVIAGPAQAQRSSVTDVTGDVRDSAMGDPVPMGADGEASADIVRTTLRHSRERVRAVVQVRDLGPGRGASPGAQVVLRVPGGDTYSVRLTATPENKPYATLISLDSYDRVPCRVTWSRSPKYDRIAFEVNRRCLDDPRWLRFGARTENESRGTRAGVIDDARLTFETPGPPKIGGPRVYAGASR